MNKQKFIAAQRQRREFRVRNRVRGDAQKPRLCVQRTHQHIACQLIDDQNSKTLVSASSRDQSLRDSLRYGGNRAAAQAVGQALAQRALAAGIQTVRFDRGSYKFHGRVAALAQAARDAGLKF
jgi:large subunit ribosomal protein L18